MGSLTCLWQNDFSRFLKQHLRWDRRGSSRFCRGTNFRVRYYSDNCKNWILQCNYRLFGDLKRESVLDEALESQVQRCSSSKYKVMFNIVKPLLALLDQTGGKDISLSLKGSMFATSNGRRPATVHRIACSL